MFYPYPEHLFDGLPEALYEKGPDTSIETGVDDGSLASKLEIYYFGDYTYVSSLGQFDNAPPWRFPGRVEPETVLGEYLAEDEAASGERRTWQSVYGPNTPKWYEV